MRPDLDVVAAMVPPGTRVLDVGCGDGTLLAHLAARRGCTGTGVEIDGDAVLAGIGRGVSVLALDADQGLGTFAADSYDVVVLSQALQAMHHPARVLAEVRRIAARAVVSVPNFGHWRDRATLLRGRMPVTRTLPYSWYDTPNIHLSTLADLEDLFAAEGLRVVRRTALDGRLRRCRRPVPNLTAPAAVYLLECSSTRGCDE